jgi:hypothetical protein
MALRLVKGEGRATQTLEIVLIEWMYLGAHTRTDVHVAEDATAAQVLAEAGITIEAGYTPENWRASRRRLRGRLVWMVEHFRRDA